MLNLSQDDIKIGISDLIALLSGQAVQVSVKPELVDLGSLGKLDISLVNGGVSIQIQH